MLQFEMKIFRGETYQTFFCDFERHEYNLMNIKKQVTISFVVNLRHRLKQREKKLAEDIVHQINKKRTSNNLFTKSNCPKYDFLSGKPFKILDYLV